MGGLPGWLPTDLATVVSAGAACLPCRLPTPPFACFFAPISPPALAERSSPPGKGEIFSFLMQGASPLASPRLRRRRHGLNLRCRCPLGSLPGWSPADLATVVSAGGLAFLVACLPRRLLAFLPLSPRPPSPVGKGEIFSFLMQGASPLASPRLSRRRHGLNLAV